MICVNELIDQKCNYREIISDFTILLSAYAPHISEEIWQKLGNKTTITKAKFPVFNDSFLTEDNINYPISFNGKTRFQLQLASNLSKEEIEKEVMKNDRTIKYIGTNTPKKIIIVPKRIVNIVL